MYPAGVRENVTVSTDESELVRTVSALELQGDTEGWSEQAVCKEKLHYTILKISIKNFKGFQNVQTTIEISGDISVLRPITFLLRIKV